MTGATRSSGHTSCPPLNFSLVERGVYRSAYPTEANIGYLRSIGIRTVALLSIETLPQPVRKTLLEGNHLPTGRDLPPDGARLAPVAAPNAASIRVIEIASLPSWRDDCLNGGDDFSQKDVQRALDIAVDTQWHPVLFCDPTGELQTSVVIGCMRRYQSWALASIFSECELFANVCRSIRASVMRFIEMWHPDDYPISEADIRYRNSEWYLRERTEHGKQGRLRRKQGNHSATSPASVTSATPLSTVSMPPCGGSSGMPIGVSSDSDADSADDDGDWSTVVALPPVAAPVTSAAVGEREVTGDTPLPPGAAVGSRFSEASGDSPSSSDVIRSVSSGATTAAAGPVTEEAALFTTSGKRPPSAWRRAGPGPSVSSGIDSPAQPPHSSPSQRQGEAGAPRSPQNGPHFSGGHHGGARPGHHGHFHRHGAAPPTVIHLAEWFVKAQEYRQTQGFRTVTPLSAEHGSAMSGQQTSEAFPTSMEAAATTGLPPPHVRYAGVRNPPALDERSTFTKESVVEEDDD